MVHCLHLLLHLLVALLCCLPLCSDFNMITKHFEEVQKFRKATVLTSIGLGISNSVL